MGVSVVRGRLPGSSELGSPSVSQNICARVPRQNPRPGTTAAPCSQPPLGVAETRLPWRSATSRWQVSPARPSVGSFVAPPAPEASGGMTGSRPSGAPGRSSSEARSPTSARRSSAYPALSSASSGTSAKSGSPYHASRSANASFAHSATVWMKSARSHRGEVEAGQQRELLEQHRALPPRPGLADRVAVVVERDRHLERRRPARQVVAGEQPALVRGEDRLRHPAAVERVARRVDARLARVAARAREPPVRLGQRAVAEQLGRPRAPRRRSRPSSSTRAAGRAPPRGSPARPGSPRPRSRSPPPARPPAPTCRSRAASGTRRRTRPARRRRTARSPGTRSRPSDRYASIVAASGAGPCPHTTTGSPRSTGHTIAGTSPPGPLRCGSTTCSTNPAATAASNALPPRSSTDIPAPDASQCVEATIPNVPRSSGRVVNVIPSGPARPPRPTRRRSRGARRARRGRRTGRSAGRRGTRRRGTTACAGGRRAA